MNTTTKNRKPGKVALRHRVRELSSSGTEDYPIHEMVLGLTESATGAYITKRDDSGCATSGRGKWWAGIAWSSAPEQGPYPTLASARKAVQTGQVLTPVLVERGFR